MPPHLLQRVRIVACCTVAAVAYGMVHDQITAHICVEYFSEAHPRIIASTSPTALGLAWGFVATWWVGFILGALLSSVSHARASAPPTPFPEIRRSVARLLGVMAIAATTAGLAGYFLTAHGLFSIPWPWNEYLPPDRHARFVGVWWAHCASYLFGFGGGVWLILRIWLRRGRPFFLPLAPCNLAGLARAAVLVAILAFVIWHRFYR